MSSANLSLCEHLRNQIHSTEGKAIDCQMLPAVSERPHQQRCTAAMSASTTADASAVVKSGLRAGTLYLIAPETRVSSNSMAMVRRIIRSITTHDAGRTSDSALRTQYFGTEGAWYRFLLDEIALPLGVHQALYLDGDALMQGDVTQMWQAADAHRNAAAIVAARSSRDTWWRKEYAGVRPGALRKWGLQPNRTFNNGVMLLNLETWCKLKALERMSAIVIHHTQVERLWSAKATSDQVVVNLALASEVYRVSPNFNTRVHSEQSGASICHGIICFRRNTPSVQLLPSSSLE